MTRDLRWGFDRRVTLVPARECDTRDRRWVFRWQMARPHPRRIEVDAFTSSIHRATRSSIPRPVVPLDGVCSNARSVTSATDIQRLPIQKRPRPEYSRTFRSRRRSGQEIDCVHSHARIGSDPSRTVIRPQRPAALMIFGTDRVDSRIVQIPQMGLYLGQATPYPRDESSSLVTMRSKCQWGPMSVHERWRRDRRREWSKLLSGRGHRSNIVVLDDLMQQQHRRRP